jgi:Stress responsive A/B Barrel Domain
MTDKGFVHTVFFWMKNPGNQADKAAFHAGLLKLAEIENIQTAYVGQPAATDRAVIDSSYDFSITFIFDTKANQDIYQDHPEHHAFINNCSPFWERVLVYDAV